MTLLPERTSVDTALVPEDSARLRVLGDPSANACANVVDALRRDQVVLLRGLEAPAQAELAIAEVARALGLLESLELQAGFAAIQGHRTGVGRYFMTVNKRRDYQFIPPHSEGVANTGIQLGCLYARQNTTDGGENLLFNADLGSPAWSRLREVAAKVDPGGRVLSRREQATLRGLYGITVPRDILAPGAEVVQQLPSTMPGVRLCNTLGPAPKAHCRILNREVPVLWDSVATIDFDCGAEFMRHLESAGLLRVPPSGASLAVLDVDYHEHTRRSGLRFAELFAAKVTHKLVAGEMLFFNNLTWAHSTSNWTPGSGERHVLAAFA